MVGLLAEKNRRLIQKSEIVSRKTLREKLMAYLSMQSQEAGSKSFIVPIGRVELAEYISADRSAITRELNAMRDEGIIDFKRNSFTIL
jgi:CRP-like cAMP-binding protein